MRQCASTAVHRGGLWHGVPRVGGVQGGRRHLPPSECAIAHMHTQPKPCCLFPHPRNVGHPHTLSPGNFPRQYPLFQPTWTQSHRCALPSVLLLLPQVREWGIPERLVQLLNPALTLGDGPEERELLHQLWVKVLDTLYQVNVNVNELRLGFSNTTRNPEVQGTGDKGSGGLPPPRA